MAGPSPPHQHHEGHQVEEEGAGEQQQAPDVLQLSEAGLHTEAVVVVQRAVRCVMSAGRHCTATTQAVQSVQPGLSWQRAEYCQ